MLWVSLCIYFMTCTWQDEGSASPMPVVMMPAVVPVKLATVTAVFAIVDALWISPSLVVGRQTVALAGPAIMPCRDPITGIVSRIITALLVPVVIGICRVGAIMVVTMMVAAMMMVVLAVHTMRGNALTVMSEQASRGLLGHGNGDGKQHCKCRQNALDTHNSVTLQDWCLKGSLKTNNSSNR
ncbi:MAG: hypothetical protein H6875_06300 [Hyphomicrobiaceae bacterium]|nr:hypothetical protein [Hyphomicrobiaceae bacterium]